MEFVRKVIDANSLMSIMTLPESLKNRKLEIILLPADEQLEKAGKASDIEEVVNSLVGMIPYSGMSLAELREERLKKYETID